MQFEKVVLHKCLKCQNQGYLKFFLKTFAFSLWSRKSLIVHFIYCIIFSIFSILWRLRAAKDNVWTVAWKQALGFLARAIVIVLFFAIFESTVHFHRNKTKYGQWPWTQLKMYESQSLFSSNRSHVVLSSAKSSQGAKSGKNNVRTCGCTIRYPVLQILKSMFFEKNSALLKRLRVQSIHLKNIDFSLCT